MQMRLALIAALLIAANGRAQMIMNPARMSGSSKNFDPRPGEPQLKCEVTPLRPTLNFSLRFQAGYAARVPLAQYAGASHTWAVYTRITPDGSSQPVYMVDRLRLPEIPKTKAEAEFGGTFLIGEGRYHVDWKLLDDGGRVCRKQWNFEARPTKDPR